MYLLSVIGIRSIDQIVFIVKKQVPGKADTRSEKK